MLTWIQATTQPDDSLVFQGYFLHALKVYLWLGVVRNLPGSSGNASYRCSMSSSADFSDEDDFSQKSGSVSPAPGDTLPWNLPKHERSKRKIQGGSVLDPAERAVLRIAAMAGYLSPGAYHYTEEQEYLQAYEDVLERYKGLMGTVMQLMKSFLNAKPDELNYLDFCVYVVQSEKTQQH
ncbi:Microtubule-actin cross-linking factor 1, isoforms 1/2/3/5 [Chelonia mydas]|uniref:Microtubule-actin cross-linking factor 1, isoforms 1/2/3/5 n=1 Tax=Chelonia mydas TaxID=8469 RepID=M7BJ54_CHEMY|nr:Microtubule-actin cross-linking factor 1, isoforms 1/2/3/5 [Chelonia mydas]